MARPETHDDLPDAEKAARSVIVVGDLDVLTQTPGAMVAYWQLVDLLRDLNVGIVVDGHDVQRELTDDELDAKVVSAQSKWDKGRVDYEKFIDTGDLPQWPWLMEGYCRAEGITPPARKPAS